MSEYQAWAQIIKALAHPARLLILQALSAGPRCAGDLTKLVGTKASTVSRHLAILKSAGILKDERRSAQVFYSVRTPCVLNVFQCVGAIQKESRTI